MDGPTRCYFRIVHDADVRTTLMDVCVSVGIVATSVRGIVIAVDTRIWGRLAWKSNKLYNTYVGTIERTTINAFLKLVRDGVGRSRAFASVCISSEDQKTLLADPNFKAELEQAENDLHNELVEGLMNVIKKEAERGQSTTLRWYMAQRFPDLYGDGDGGDIGEVNFPFDDVPTDELRKKAGTDKRFIE